MDQWLELVLGIILIIVAVSLLIEFVATFAKLSVVASRSFAKL